jgi:hypothetical protein
MADQRDTIHIGHVDICDDHVKRAFLRDFQAMRPVIGGGDGKTRLSQGKADHIPHGFGIING